MPRPLELLSPNDRLPARWLNDLAAEVRSQRIMPSPGMRVKRTPNGTFLDPRQGGGGGRGGSPGGISAKVVSVGYYDDGMYSGTDVLNGGSVSLCLPVWSQTGELPSGTRILALEVEAAATGGWS